MSENNRLNEIIQTSLESIRSMVDSNTVIGNPITTVNGTTIIPVSKVFVGFASGGVDYLGNTTGGNSNGQIQKSDKFGGGGGTGLTVAPVAFLIVDIDGNVQLLNVNEPTKQEPDPIGRVVDLLERSPELIEKIKTIFAKKDEKENSPE